MGIVSLVDTIILGDTGSGVPVPFGVGTDRVLVS